MHSPETHDTKRVMLIASLGERLMAMSDSEFARFSASFAGAREDAVDPHHYKRLKPEPIHVIRAWNLNFNRGNAVKYAVRAGEKDPATAVEDLRKAIAYLKNEIMAISQPERLVDHVSIDLGINGVVRIPAPPFDEDAFDLSDADEDIESAVVACVEGR